LLRALHRVGGVSSVGVSGARVAAEEWGGMRKEIVFWCVPVGRAWRVARK
jgi:hypothetical protein